MMRHCTSLNEGLQDHKRPRFSRVLPFRDLFASFHPSIHNCFMVHTQKRNIATVHMVDMKSTRCQVPAFMLGTCKFRSPAAASIPSVVLIYLQTAVFAGIKGEELYEQRVQSFALLFRPTQVRHDRLSIGIRCGRASPIKGRRMK